jgi:hypothetical protein
MIARLAAVSVLALTACSPSPVPSYSSNTPTQILTTLDSAGVRDLRPVYRAALCPRLPAAGAPCDDVLLRLADEAGPPASFTPRAEIRERYRIAFVPGFLAECFGDMAQPFADVMDELARAGFAVHYLPTAGRGDTERNSAQLAAQLAAMPPDTRPFIVFAHSKGLPDVLALLARYPQTVPKIAAVVSVAGAMNGSPLADRLNPAFRKWLSALPMRRCDRGDGDEFEDLRREVRLAWWQRHRASITTPVFALVTTPRADRLSPLLKEMYEELASVEPRNDGQLLWYDQIVPGGHLLGYVNADHWGIGVSVSQAVPPAKLLIRDDVPRTALVQAAIEVVDSVLDTAPRAARSAPAR